MHGTNWVAPGEGSTVAELASATAHARLIGADRDIAHKALVLLIVQGATAGSKTRLALNGHDLGGYDCDRIQALLNYPIA